MAQIFICFLLCLQTNAGDRINTGTESVTEDVGVFANALWLLQTYGHPDCSAPSNDRRVKAVLAKSYAKDRELTFEALSGLMGKDSFAKIAGGDNCISEGEMLKALRNATPFSRLAMNPDLRHHADLLTTSFDMIEADHGAAIDQLAEWIAKSWKPDSTLHVLTTCTGNSRRSILGSTMGNFAAAYYGFDNVRFHSGGTKPSAFNKRTIATLKEIGFQIEPVGDEAERGDSKTANPIFRVVWGKDLECLEFSKSYKDKANPQSEFAAILVCSEADAECPTVSGASLRVSMTFIDPKLYDDGVFEKAKYAERRDDIGRTFLAVMANARRRLQEQK